MALRTSPAVGLGYCGKALCAIVEPEPHVWSERLHDARPDSGALDTGVVIGQVAEGVAVVGTDPWCQLSARRYRGPLERWASFQC